MKQVREQRDIAQMLNIDKILGNTECKTVVKRGCDNCA